MKLITLNHVKRELGESNNNTSVRQEYKRTTAAAIRRAALFLCLILMGVGGAKAEETELTTGWADNCFIISADQFSGINETSILRIYESADAEIYIATNWNWTPMYTGNGHIYSGSSYYNSSKGCMELTVGSELEKYTNNGGIRIQAQGGQTISKITIETPAAVVDEFFGQAASGAATDSDVSEQLERTVTSGTFNLSGASITGTLHYARIYLADASGTQLSAADQSLLTVTYDGAAATIAGTNPSAVTKEGYYVYDASASGLDLSKVSVTLNIGSGKKLTDYQVVCLISTGLGTVTSGVLTKEPDWNLTYTYTFQYEPLQAATWPLELIDRATLETVSEAEFNIQETILQKFGKTAADIKASWFTKWYVVNNSGTQQALECNWNAQNDKWTVAANGSCTDNAKFDSHLNCGTESWGFTNNAGKIKFVAPSGKHLSDYAGWKFVCETSDVYDGTNADPTHIFYIPIPSAITFEYDGTPTNTDVTQALARNALGTATLDWTKMTTATGYTYARFYVVDASGTPVLPTDAAHQLTVSGATATLCTTGESGYYVYTGSALDLNDLTVTLTSSSGDVRPYKVVCWLANTETGLNHEGTTVKEEPDIDVAYTYSFTKEAVSTTVEKTATIDWSATQMTADATDGAPTDWNTTWADLSLEQRVVWYVTDGSGTKQALAIGTGAAADTWTLNAGTGFTLDAENQAVLTGQTSFTQAQWNNTWGRPTLYAPANKAYADVHDYKVICEVYESATGTTPNVRYTFTFRKAFPGTLKSGATTSTQREVLTAGAVTCTLSDVTLPSGTKYARFYLTDGSNTIVAPTGKLSVTGATAVSATGYENYGYYLYDETGITAAPTVTLTLAAAELNQYKVVMVTSADRAVVSGGAVTSEPDYDTQKTWTFKYPTNKVEGTATLEWNPDKMEASAVPIETLKGAGYLDGVKASYLVQWTVEDASGTVQPLVAGHARQTGAWAFSRQPYTVSDNAATINSNASLSAENWATWGAPVFYAPAEATFNDVKDLLLVCRLYEADEVDAPSLALEYKVSLVKTTFYGQPKHGATEASETVEDIEEDATSVSVPLANALKVFGQSAKYARIWLTNKSGDLVDQSSLTVSGATTFSNTHTNYEYYITVTDDASAISLPPTATLTATPFTDYQVHVALSVDAPVSTDAFARATRAESLTSYEPDYDYQYTFDFAYAAKGKVIHKYVKATEAYAVLDFGSEYLSNLGKSSLSELENSHTFKWYLLDGNGQAIAIEADPYNNNKDGKFNFKINGGGNNGWPFTMYDDNKYLYFYEGVTNTYKDNFTAEYNDFKLYQATVYPPSGNSDFSAFMDYTVVCVTSAENPTVSGGVITDPDVDDCVTYIFHFNSTGLDPFIGEEKSSIVSGTKVVEIANSEVTSATGIDVTDQRAVAALVSDGFVPKYVRWQVFDQDDNLVDGVLTTGSTTTKAEGLGEYIYNSTGTLDLLRGLSIDVSGQTDKDLTHYRIVGLVSDCSTDDHLVMNGLKVKEEPDFDLKVTVTFETAFRGQLTANAVEREIVITQLASQWDRTVTNQSEFMIEISDAGKTVTLKDKAGNVRTTKSLDILTDLKTATGESYSSLSELQNLYVRWYLERKDGSAVVVKGAIRKDDTSDVHFLPNNATEGANLAHGFYWYKNGSTYSIASAGTSANAVKVKFVQSGEYLPTGGIDITDYNLVLNVSTHTYSEYDAAYVNADHNINHEPDALDLRYVFNFQNRAFPADNIATVKTIYKDALYTIERDTDDNPVSGKITPVLFNNINSVLTDMGVNSATFKANSYARWYIADKSGNIVSDIDSWQLTPSNSGASYTQRSGYGYYATPIAIDNDSYNKSHFDPIITLPAGYDLEQDYKDYQVVCVVTTDQTGMELPATEPATMQVKYVFNLILTEGDYASLPFVHYKGQTGRDWVTPEESNGTLAQQVWTDGAATDYTGDIRQGVHTWEYDVFLSDGVDRELILPLEKYLENGNPLEPRAYFRWYDYTTDQAVTWTEADKFSIRVEDAATTKLRSISDAQNRDRGLFAIGIGSTDGTAAAWGVIPTQKTVGIRITTQEGFVANGKSYDIACDVSKYADGISVFNNGGDRSAYLIHEPTLSTRYIFHIYPGSIIANDMAAADRKLRVVQQQIADAATADEKHRIFSNNEYEMFDVHENKGKVVVSLGSADTQFSLRLDEHSLRNYKLWRNNDPSTGELLTADRITWVAFFENDEHILRKELKHTDKRVELFSYNDFLGTYHTITTGSDREEFDITDGKKFHVVGYVGDETMNTAMRTGNYAPVAHYEIHFLQAPPLKLTSLKDDTDGVRLANLNRTDEYMKAHYDLKRIVDFDGNPETNPNLEGREAEFYSTPNWYDAPATSAENMTWEPRQWTDIEYGFCYPQLTPYIMNGYNVGLAPEHGDYMIIKSMNAEGISTHMNTPPHNVHWWNDAELYDYTHTYTDPTKYGSFLYTDASDESRTMVTIPFNAELCAGSTIYFTMVVADKTSGTIKPQLLVRIVGVDGEGNRSRVVAFHTSDICSAGASTGDWWQVYGESTIPVTFDDNIESFIAEVINYADDTNGADFAIDQLQIYTSTAKVQMKQDPSSCDDPTDGKVKIYVDAEGMQNIYLKDNDQKKIYWRICDEETGEVVTGPGMYPWYDYDATNGWSVQKQDDGTHQYGIAWVVTNFSPTSDVYAFATDGVDHLPEMSEAGGAPFGWYKGTDNTIYFQIAYRHLPGIKEGKTYYVSIYDPTESQKYSVNFREAYWGGLHHGATSKCSVFSSFFLSRRQYVTYSDPDGNVEGGATIAECGQPAVADHLPLLLKVPDATEPTGFRTVSGLHYDFAYMQLDNAWNNDENVISDKREGVDATYTLKQVREAWRRYRGDQSEYKLTKGLPESYRNVNVVDGVDDYDVLKAAVDNGDLELTASTTFSHVFQSQSGIVTCLPIEQELDNTDDSNTTMICSPFEVDFHVKAGEPDLALGFPDVSYPTEGYERRVLRVGLEQLNNLKNNGYKLHIPINRYNDKSMVDGNDEMNQARRLYFEDPVLRLSSDVDAPEFDPACKAAGITTGAKFATIVSTDAASEHPYVDFDHMYLALDLSQCEIPFHEGYEYEVSTTFFDEEDAITSEGGNFVTDEHGNPTVATNACRGNIFLIIKVVPEYVTWTGREMDAYSGYYSANWNDDRNWTRSERDVLYKDGTTLGAKNTATDGHPDGYMNNGEGTLADLGTETGNPAFVPMKFTYVTIPDVATAHAPNLTTQPTAYGDPATAKYRGGNLIVGTLMTDPSPMGDGTDSPTSCDPTANIRFDMLVRYTETDCQGHYNKAKEVVGEGTTKVYDCEKYYGNICREIYFKPGAELQKQQRLTYEKAWVEKELQPNRWYLMAAPLRATYAGDMYVPWSATATEHGRQTSEAFQPISFSTTADAAGYAYSRTRYPIYQHAWGEATIPGASGATIPGASASGTTDGPRVYTTADDTRQTSYSASLNYDSWSGSVVEWSHTYDDVQVPYSELTAYAIRANRKQLDEPALLRLPKKDTSYDYFRWNDTNREPAAGDGIKTVEKEFSEPVKPEIFSDEAFNQDPNAYAKLVADKDYQAEAVTVDISKAQHLNGYVLVGNPYMSSISMKAFFNADKNELDESRVPNRDAVISGALEKSYWIYDEATGALRAYKDAGVIRPLQAFFLKTSANVTFTHRMMMDYHNGETPGVQGTNPRPQLTLQTQGGSMATVELTDEASAEYVVNEDVETLFDQHLADRPTVFTVAGSREVSIDQRPDIGTVPFGVVSNGTEPVDVKLQWTTAGTPLYLYDAAENKQTEVTDGQTVSIVPNDYGRYFLTAETQDIDTAQQEQKAIIVSVRGHQVTVTSSADDLTDVAAYAADGATAYSHDGAKRSCTFQLQGGIYIVKASTAHSSKTMKVVVK